MMTKKGPWIAVDNCTRCGREYELGEVWVPDKFEICRCPHCNAALLDVHEKKHMMVKRFVRKTFLSWGGKWEYQDFERKHV